MVPNLSKPGHSFIGAEKYHNRDKRKKKDKKNERVVTRDRVEWTSMRNLMTDDPAVATKIMIATAMDAARMKEAAGIKNTGRKSNAHVQTLSLAWHPDERVSREEMERTADEVIELLDLQERQVVVYSHNDTDHQHIHLVINRVCPNSGRMATLSNAKRKLDKWAHEYEQRRGRIVSPNRDAKYRRQDEAKKRHPDARKRRAYAEMKRREAREKSTVTHPKSKRWSLLEAAEARRAAQEAAKAPDVPLDRQEAAEWLLRPLMGFEQVSNAAEKTALTVFAHDPDPEFGLEVGDLLMAHLPKLLDPSDPQQVRAQLDTGPYVDMPIMDEIYERPELEKPFGQLTAGLRQTATDLRAGTWAKITRTLDKVVGKRVADTIRRSVDFIANLFRDEKVAKLPKPTEVSRTTGSKRSVPPAPPKTSSPDGGYSP